MTNTWDAANRLTQIAVGPKSEIVNLYNEVNDRVGQTVDGVTTHFALDVQGLPEVIYTSEGNAYLHLPGVIMTENITGEVRYLLSDGLGSVRQAVDDTGSVVGYNEFDPYGNPIVNRQSEIVNPYGFTGEWWQSEVGLLHLRARWYAPEIGAFLSRDAWEGSKNEYRYVNGNPINLIDPFGWYGCNSTTGRCDDGRYLCVIQGKWSGSYVDGKPCIVNPNNVQTGNAPAPSVPWPILISPNQPPVTPLPTTISTERDPSRLQTFAQLTNVTGVTGYLEGWAVSGTLATCNILVVGQEIVYDFYTGQRAVFDFIGQPYKDAPIPFPTGESIPTLADASGWGYAGFIWGFDREPARGLVDEYGGPFVVGFGTMQTPTPIVTGNGAVNVFSSASDDWHGWWPNLDVYGITFAAGAGAGGGALDLPVSVGAIRTNYTLNPEILEPFSYRDEMAQDIRNGANVPTVPGWLLGAIDYAIGYRSLAADVAQTASPDAEWEEWEK